MSGDKHLDLFGQVIAQDHAMHPDQRHKLRPKRPTPKKRGYAAPPGSGPAGETCRGCKHYYSKGYGRKTYPKCELMRAYWNHSHGSDIKASSPACKRWEKPDDND